MKRLMMIVCGLLLLGTSVVVGQEKLVRIKLQDGTVLEGPLVSENDQQVVIREERAGGTIQQNRTIPRKDVAEMAELSAAEQQQRAEQLAYRDLQRYQLNAASSYQPAYYTQVVERVFRPFVQSFPDSPHATEVQARLDAWLAEYARAAGGETKYQGTWMPAAAAAKLFAEENSAQLFRQAQTLISQKQYAKAIDRLDQLRTPEARNLTVDAYRQWVQTLETQQQQAAQQVQAAQERVNRVQPGVGGSASRQPRSVFGAARDAASGKSYQGLGEQGQDVIAANKAKVELSNANRDLSLAQQRLTAAESELSRVRPLATAAGALQTVATGPATSDTGGTTNPLYVNVSADKEDWSNPSLLQNMWRFLQHYWMAGAAVLVLGGWWLTRKLGK